MSLSSRDVQQCSTAEIEILLPFYFQIDIAWDHQWWKGLEVTMGFPRLSSSRE
jgi:hypothetical protein